MRSFTSAAAVLLLVIVACAAPALGHGYLSNPPSRQAQCNRGQVSNCGQVQYEPQSVEALKGKRSCNGDIATWAPLADESKAWVVTSLPAGTSSFTWTLTAAHATASYEYYIGSTRVGFFPTSATTHAVNLAGYSGRQKILAIWNIGDTANAFYACVDVNIGSGGGGSTTPTTAPTVRPTTAPTSTPTTSTPTSTPTTGCATTLYTVVSGDRLSAIATTYGVTLANLLAANSAITNADLIYIGQVISIPSASCTTGTTTTTTTTTTPRPRRRASGYNETDGITGDAIEGFTGPDETTSGAEVVTDVAKPALHASAARPSATLSVTSACVTLLGVVALAFAQ